MDALARAFGSYGCRAHFRSDAATAKAVTLIVIMLMSFLVLDDLLEVPYCGSRCLFYSALGSFCLLTYLGHLRHRLERRIHTLVLVSSIVYCMANLPTSIAFVYKEYVSKDLNIHPVHLTQWVSIYQCIFWCWSCPCRWCLV